MGDSQIEISHELFEMSYKINSHRISLIGDIRIVWEILVPCEVLQETQSCAV